MNLILPADSVGAIMKLCEDRRGTYIKTEYIGTARLILVYEMPLAEVIYDFYDRLKSATRGYGTMDYELIGFRVGDLVKLDVLVNGDRVDALSVIVHKAKAEARGANCCFASRRKSPSTSLKSPCKRPSAAKSSPAKPSKASAKTSPPNATAAT